MHLLFVVIKRNPKINPQIVHIKPLINRSSELRRGMFVEYNLRFREVYFLPEGFTEHFQYMHKLI